LIWSTYQYEPIRLPPCHSSTKFTVTTHSYPANPATVPWLQIRAALFKLCV